MIPETSVAKADIQSFTFVFILCILVMKRQTIFLNRTNSSDIKIFPFLQINPMKI